MESETEDGNEQIEVELQKEINENQEPGNLDAENHPKISESRIDGEREEEEKSKSIEESEESEESDHDLSTPEERMELTMPVPAKYLQNCNRCARRMKRRGRSSGSQ